jgi:hypothetical protein
VQVSHANPPTLLLVVASMARNVALAQQRGSTTPEDQAELDFLNTGKRSGFADQGAFERSQQQM